ncbi:MAG: hypothetical protein HY317_01565 [Acidobacteria bacterium]|nr:hypothetical protein [Acidobacteriota bacterium]
MNLGRYALVVLGIVGGSLAVVWPLLGDDRRRGAVLFGAVLAAANTLLAHFLVRWSVGRSTGAFLGAVLGGMVGRMGLMLTAVVAGILALELPKVPLAVSLLAYFVLFLVVELAVLQKQTSPRVQLR